MSHEAVVIPEKGAKIAVVSKPTVDAQKDEVQVRVDYSSIEHIDKNQAASFLYIESYPYGLGKSFSGTISQDSGDFKKGDKVAGYSYSGGAYQQYVTVPSHQVTKYTTSTLSDAEISTIPHAWTTSYTTLFFTAGLQLSLSPTEEQKSEPIIIWGASANTGIYAIQILRLFGYNKILAVASPRHFEKLKKLGAIPFDRHSETIVQDLKPYKSKRVAVFQADLKGYDNLIKATEDGTRVTYIIRAVPDNIPSTHSFSRTVVFVVNKEKEVGAGATSSLGKAINEGSLVLAKPNVQVLSEGSLAERVSKGFELDGTVEDGLTVKFN
eukprot:TRINITY_DN6833_c0_g1_i1.p1 TRINITY_DN6833_c0_g1~~TRINITY_DN6833_c0_g1_i1.p1  ORF type:complete len:324 (-),score=69.28 TRINITY_DN6833_c0_g1_i1:37-1008(-)